MSLLLTESNVLEVSFKASLVFLKFSGVAFFSKNAENDWIPSQISRLALSQVSVVIGSWKIQLVSSGSLFLQGTISKTLPWPGLNEVICICEPGGGSSTDFLVILIVTITPSFTGFVLTTSPMLTPRAVTGAPFGSPSTFLNFALLHFE